MTAADSERREDSASTPLLQLALEAELSGDNVKRQEYLAARLRATPDDPATRWHAGCVRVGDEWLQVQIAEDQVAQKGLVFEYRKLRDQYAGTVNGQVALARWCRKNKLEEHELLHWAAVLSFDPTNRDARSRLGIREYRGMLLTKTQLDEHKKSQKEYEAALSRWKPQLRRWRKAMEGADAKEREKAVAELRLIEDVTALPALDEVFSDADEELLLEVVGVAGAINEQLGADLLLKYAVAAESAAVRDAAASELGKRSLYGFVPALLANM